MDLKYNVINYSTAEVWISICGGIALRNKARM